MHCYILNIEAEVAGHNVHFDSLRPSQLCWDGSS